jgi:hypothetical protein
MANPYPLEEIRARNAEWAAKREKILTEQSRIRKDAKTKAEEDKTKEEEDECYTAQGYTIVTDPEGDAFVRQETELSQRVCAERHRPLPPLYRTERVALVERLKAIERDCRKTIDPLAEEHDRFGRDFCRTERTYRQSIRDLSSYKSANAVLYEALKEVERSDELDAHVKAICDLRKCEEKRRETIYGAIRKIYMAKKDKMWILEADLAAAKDDLKDRTEHLRTALLSSYDFYSPHFDEFERKNDAGRKEADLNWVGCRRPCDPDCGRNIECFYCSRLFCGYRVYDSMCPGCNPDGYFP